MHTDRERQKYAYRRSIWLLAWHYLNGARRFDVFDTSTGRMSPHYLDKEGNMEFQSQDLLSMIDRTVARVASVDLRPKVIRQGTSLSMIRERSSAQIIVDSLISDHQLSQITSDFAHIFVTLGCCGITGHLVDVPTIGLSADLEVVHPRELYPFPSMQQDHTKLSGIIRQRVVPIDMIEKRFGKKLGDKKETCEWWAVDYGNTAIDVGLDESGDAVRNPFNNTSVTAGNSGPVTGASWTEVIRIRELWLDGPRGTCSRYVVTSGDEVLYDEEYKDVAMFCPIGFARFCDTGTFYGAGLFDLLFGISREAERMMKSLFNNIRDTDRYGVLVLPQGAMNERTLLKEVGKGLRVMPFTPDPLNENFKPFMIQPWNAGDAPGKVAQFARDVMQQISPVQDLIQEKGRVDSATGLQFLDEQITRAMTNPSMGIQRAFGNMYRSLSAQAVAEIVKFPRTIPITNVTLDLAGAVIDVENSTVSFEKNPIPDIGHLNFTVKQINPRSEVARKEEAMGLLKSGLTDPIGFKIFALKEGLDFAMWMDEEKGAFETIVLHILQLYGNGQDPGQVVLTQHMLRPDVQMRVLGGFMTSPILSVASAEVKDEFRKFRDTMLQFMGQTLPQQVPTPDEAAAMGMQQPQPGQQQQMPPEGMMPNG